MLNFAVCDDNIIILNRLCKMLESIFIENNLDAEIVFSTTSTKKLLEYSQNNNIDVLILDIDFKNEISGIETGKIIRKNNKNIYLIFSTAHLEYVLIAYKLKTFDYLPKPVTSEKLKETILRVFEDVSERTKETNFIRVGKSKVLVKENDIKYIKKDGMKLVYHTNKKNYEVYSSFNQIQDTLPKNFVRCHKSYIVNVNNITNIKSNNTVFFNTNEYCNIGPKYKDNLMEVFNNGNSTKYLDSFDKRE